MELLGYVFFTNYFYGICAVALSIEASLQQRLPLNGLAYYILVFLATVLYYGYPYVGKCKNISNNVRAIWHRRHYRFMLWNQLLVTVILFLSLVSFLKDHWILLLSLLPLQWAIIFIFPLTAALYYGINFLYGEYSLRKIGWLKPFIIGFTWAGLVTVYPVIFYCLVHKTAYQINLIGGLLFLKNFMFVTVLCIMFDIKDYATDYVNRVRTFVVNAGLRKTIFSILIPFSLLGLVSFLVYAIVHGFHPLKIVLNCVPFLLLIIIAFSFSKRHSILYYLAVVDGLMLLKAVLGGIAMVCF